MISNIDIFLDSSSLGVIPGGSLPDGIFPTFTRGDTYNIRLLIKENSPSNQFVDADTTGGSFKFAIGGIDAIPDSGQFKLLVNGVTSSAITFSTSPTSLAQSIYTAISNNVSTINPFGFDEGAFICTATANNTALTISGDTFTLFPSSSIIVGNRISHSANEKAQKVLKLRRNPAVYADNFADVLAGTAIELVKVVDGDSNTFQNETYRIDVGTAVLGGSFVLNYGVNSTTAIPVFSSAGILLQALNSVTGLFNAIDVASNSNGGYSISFVRGLGQTNIVTPFTIDTSGIYYQKYKQAVVTMATVELDELFSLEDASEITSVVEIQYLDSGSPKTLLQGEIEIRKDLILGNTSLPVNTASYYTKAEADSLFVEEATSGAAGTINANNFSLHSSDGKKSIDWNQRKLLDGAVEYLRWDDGLGFYGSSAISKPSGTNLINSITRTGLISYTTPSGTNLINSITQTGLIQYTAPSGVNLINSLTQTGIINYTVPTSTNLVSALNSTGLLNYSVVTGTNVVSVFNASGLLKYSPPTIGTILQRLNSSGVISSFTVPSGTNFVSSAVSSGILDYTPVTKNNYIDCIEDFGIFPPYVDVRKIGPVPLSIGSNVVSFSISFQAFTDHYSYDPPSQNVITMSANTAGAFILPLYLSDRSPPITAGPILITNYNGIPLNQGDILEVYPRPSFPGVYFSVNVATFTVKTAGYLANLQPHPDGPLWQTFSDILGLRLSYANTGNNVVTLFDYGLTPSVPPRFDFKLLHIAF